MIEYNGTVLLTNKIKTFLRIDKYILPIANFLHLARQNKSKEAWVSRNREYNYNVQQTA